MMTLKNMGRFLVGTFSGQHVNFVTPQQIEVKDAQNSPSKILAYGSGCQSGKAKVGCTTKTEPGGGDKAQQGENILNSIVPQYPSKKSRAGPVTVSWFRQSQVHWTSP